MKTKSSENTPSPKKIKIEKDTKPITPSKKIKIENDAKPITPSKKIKIEKDTKPISPSKKIKIEKDTKPISSLQNGFGNMGKKTSPGKKKIIINTAVKNEKSKGFSKKDSPRIESKKKSPTKESLKKYDPTKRGTLITGKSKLGQNQGFSKKKAGGGKGKKNIALADIPANLIGNDGKPKWAKLKVERKKLKQDRKVHRSGAELYQLSVKAKSIWEKLRLRTLKPNKREELVNDLFRILRGSISNVVHSHDLTRVVQWMLKLGSPSIRTSICEELCSNTVFYLQSKYACYCVKRALKYGTKGDRNYIIASCRGSFLKLLNNSYASKVVELMYSTYASAQQRKEMHVEMYGEMCALLPSAVTSIENVPKNLKPAILVATKMHLTKLLSKNQRNQLLRSTLVQSILIDYLSSCSNEDRTEIFELIQGDILDFLSTKEGYKVALLIVWYATNKLKKTIIKTLKGKVKEVATSEAGHIFLMALFDCIDDTVLFKKALIPELVSEAEDLVNNEFGRKVILYLVAHRDPAYFHPQQIEILSKGDSINTGKKDKTVREQEMLEAVSGPLLEKIVENPVNWFEQSSVAMVSLAVMKSGKGNTLQMAFEKLADYMLDPNSMVEVNERQVHVIEHSAIHLVFKKLIMQDQSHPDRTKETFSMILANKLTAKSLNHILQFNRGCFLLIRLFESTDKNVRKTITSKITKPMITFLNNQETTGAEILLKKVNEL